MLSFFGKNKIQIERFGKFLLIGGSALLIDIALYYVFTRELHISYLLSRVYSLSVAIFWNFYLNRIWTFTARGGSLIAQFWRFLTVIGITSLANLLFMHIGVSVLGFHDIGVILFVSVLLTLVNFTAHSFWSYAIKQT